MFQPLEPLEQRLMLAADIALYGGLAFDQAIATGDGSPTTVDGTDLGKVNLAANAASTFHIKNTGDATLTLTGSKVALSSWKYVDSKGTIVTAPGGADFVLTQVAGSTIAPPASDPLAYKEFAVTFKPKALSDRYAVVTVFSNDPDENPYQFLIHGTGIIQDVALYGGDNKNVEIPRNDTTPNLTDHTNFGTVLPGPTGVPVPWTFRVSNAGTDALNFTGSKITITGTNAGDFILTPFAATTIPASGTTYADFTITFAPLPSAAGLRTATVNVFTNDPDEATYSFRIQGTGGGQDIALFGGANMATEILRNDTTPSLTDHTNLGYAMVGGAATTWAFRIANMGGDLLNFTGAKIDITGANKNDFVLGAFTATSVPIYPGTQADPNYADFTLTFSPLAGAAGSVRTATVNVYTNDPDEPTYSFKVQGTVANADIAVFGGANTAISIPRGDTTPSLTDHTDFGNVDLGGAAGGWTFRITNPGKGALSLTGTQIRIVTASGADSSVFTVSLPSYYYTGDSSTTADDIPFLPIPGSPGIAATMVTSSLQKPANPNYRDITINFDPDAIGVHTATVKIYSDAPGKAVYSFAIQGTGVAERLTTNSALQNATEDTPFVIDYSDLFKATHEYVQPANPLSFLISSVQAGTLSITHGGATAPVVAGTTIFAPGDSLTWTPPANANRTINAFSVRETDGVTPGPVLPIRVEVAPVADNPVGDIADQVVNSLKTIDLTKLFVAPDASGTIVKYDTVLGTFYADLLTQRAPKTVANFLKYVAAKRYDGSWFHRSVTNFVLQGGGYYTQDPATGTTAASALAVPTYTPVVNEYGVSSQVGTISMAKVGNNPNSATSQWFFNLGDNSQNLDNQNGGFTVFGEVMGAGMTVVNAMAAVTIYNAGGDLSSLPLRNYTTGNVVNSNLLIVNSVSVVTPLTFEIRGNVNHADAGQSSPVTATLVDGVLTLAPVAGRTGYADITIRVSDCGGDYTDITFVAATTSVKVTASDAAAAETASGLAPNGATFTFTRTGPTTAAQAVDFTLTGTAVANTDYTVTGATYDAGAAKWTVTIPAGVTSAAVTIAVIDDAVKEGTENIVATLLPGSTYLPLPVGSTDTANIVDNDLFVVWIDRPDADAAETPAGVAPNGGMFRVHRDVAAATPLTVSLTRTGTATSGKDFVALPASVTIPPNEDHVDVPLTVINDVLADANETVILTTALRAGGGYVLDSDIAKRTATITIVDDEPLVTIAATDPAASELGPDNGTFHVERTGSTAASLNVTFSTTGSTATRGADYVLQIGGITFTTNTIPFGAGVAAVDVTVVPLVDTTVESTESVVLTLSTSSLYSVPPSPGNKAVVQIASNQPPTLTSVDVLTGAIVNTPFTITYDDLKGAANEADPEGQPISFKITAISGGTLFKDGTQITSAMLLSGVFLASGEELVWDPPANATNVQNAFKVTAFDDVMSSITPIQVKVDVTLVPV